MFVLILFYLFRTNKIKGGFKTVWQFGKGKIDAGRLINLMTDNLNCKNEYQSSKSDYYSD